MYIVHAFTRVHVFLYRYVYVCMYVDNNMINNDFNSFDFNCSHTLTKFYVWMYLMQVYWLIFMVSYTVIAGSGCSAFISQNPAIAAGKDRFRKHAGTGIGMCGLCGVLSYHIIVSWICLLLRSNTSTKYIRQVLHCIQKRHAYIHTYIHAYIHIPHIGESLEQREDAAGSGQTQAWDPTAALPGPSPAGSRPLRWGSIIIIIIVIADVVAVVYLVSLTYFMFVVNLPLFRGGYAS